MILMRYLVESAILAIVLTSCSSSKNVVPDSSPSELYASVQWNLQNGNYKVAIQKLEMLVSRHPFASCSGQVQLDLIYAYYKDGDLPLVQASINRFLRFNPTHPNVDYVLYMRGLTNMALDDNALQEFFGVDRSDRNPAYARMAFDDFKQLIRRYPNSQYVVDASKRLVYLKNRLAKYELSVVEYYHKRGAYIAVISRVEEMLRDFPDTQATRQALPYMKKAYVELQLNHQANKVAEIIALNPA